MWYACDVKKTKKKAVVPLPDFRTGQVWRLSDSNLQIGQIGKTLVHYKHYRGVAQRAPISLAVKGDLEKFLIKHEAVLVQS